MHACGRRVWERRRPSPVAVCAKHAPSHDAVHAAAATSHIRTLLSREPEQSVAPSDESAIAEMESLWPLSSAVGAGWPVRQSFISVSRPAEMAPSSRGAGSTRLTPFLWPRHECTTLPYE